jgi:hypothetical protein
LRNIPTADVLIERRGRIEHIADGGHARCVPLRYVTVEQRFIFERRLHVFNPMRIPIRHDAKFLGHRPEGVAQTVHGRFLKTCIDRCEKIRIQQDSLFFVARFRGTRKKVVAYELCLKSRCSREHLPKIFNPRIGPSRYIVIKRSIVFKHSEHVCDLRRVPA